MIKADIILFFQTLIILVVLAILTKKPLSTMTVIEGIFVMWFYWLYLKHKNLINKAEALNTQARDMRENSTYKELNHFLMLYKLPSFFSPLMMIGMLSLYFYRKALTADVTLILCLDIFITSLMKICGVNRFIAEIVAIFQIQGDVEPNLNKTLLYGFTSGLPYTLVIYASNNTTWEHYLLHYFGFSALTSYSLLLISTYKRVNILTKKL